MLEKKAKRFNDMPLWGINVGEKNIGQETIIIQYFLDWVFICVCVTLANKLLTFSKILAILKIYVAFLTKKLKLKYNLTFCLFLKVLCTAFYLIYLG